MLKQLSRDKLQTGLIGSRNCLDGQNGIAAELEEVIVDTDVGRAQQFSPDLRDRSLDFVPWQHAFCSVSTALVLRFQSGPI